MEVNQNKTQTETKTETQIFVGYPFRGLSYPGLAVISGKSLEEAKSKLLFQVKQDYENGKPYLFNWIDFVAFMKNRDSGEPYIFNWEEIAFVKGAQSKFVKTFEELIKAEVDSVQWKLTKPENLVEYMSGGK